MKRNQRIFFFTTSAVVLSCANLSAASPNLFEVQNLVSDLPGVAQFQDANLVNPWGLASSPTSPFWVANNGSGTSTLYDSSGQPFPQPTPRVVTIPPAPGETEAVPTGVVFNPSASQSPGAFPLGNGQNALFIFSTENGAIAGWNGLAGNTALNMSANPAAAYKGLGIAGSGSGARLYAPDFAGGKIDVFDASFQAVSISGAFTDPNLPAGFSPFNIQNLGDKLYVTYALKSGTGAEDVPGAGNGLVNVFDLNGNLQKRLISGGALNSPWGLEIAPADFGPFGGNLLVGNFGDGRINAYDLTTGDLLGTLNDKSGVPMEIEGLWALKVGNGGNGGDPRDVYFTAGSDDENHGLFGEISFADEGSVPTVPDGRISTAVLLAASLFGLRFFPRN